MRQSLEAAGVFGPELEDSVSCLDRALAQLPEPKKKSLDVLGPPAELKGLDAGLALYTDGACRGNPGPGAWAAVAQKADGEMIFQSAGHEALTTNNKMEIQAVIGALQQLEDYFLSHPFAQFSPIILLTDSKYVVDGVNQWTTGWKARGWRKADGKSPENLELWQSLDQHVARFPGLKVSWVKGHAGHPQNEYCDQLANRLLDDEGF